MLFHVGAQTYVFVRTRTSFQKMSDTKNPKTLVIVIEKGFLK